MRIKILLMAVLVLSVLLTTAWAADIAGTWKGSQEMMGQTMERSFTFVVDKSDPTKFTGTSPGRQGGENQITEGKIDGDKISFNVKMTGKMEMTMKYSGTIKGDEMTLTMTMDFGAGGPPGGGMGGGPPGGGGGMAGGPPGGGGGMGGPPAPLVLKKVK
jgi:hypothetical protein